MNINNDDDEDEIDRKICLTSKELLSSQREDNNIESKSLNILFNG